jgi:hypothetical protein
MITRKQYLAGKASFQEYYGQFVTTAVLAAIKCRFGLALAKSTDPHFNDIPLRDWDLLADRLRPVLGRRIAEANENGGVSLSDLVCTLKVGAMKIREAESR